MRYRLYQFLTIAWEILYLACRGVVMWSSGGADLLGDTWITRKFAAACCAIFLAALCYLLWGTYVEPGLTPFLTDLLMATVGAALAALAVKPLAQLPERIRARRLMKALTRRSRTHAGRFARR
jgi:peptidoglycan/LPS O-acetylase OafA/YrhL